jgi:hypothetical protein
MNAKTRIEKLEAKAAPDGSCPHLPAIVNYFDSDGTPLTARGTQDETPCTCGRERLRIRVEFVQNWRKPDEVKAADLSDDELAAIIARGD